MLLPIGLDHARVGRMPWVTFSIAGLCLLALVASGLATDEAGVEERYGELTAYWGERPWLAPPPSLRDHLEHGARSDDPLLAAKRPEAPPDVDAAAQQRRLDDLSEALYAEVEAQPDRRWALVPARGIAQPGWLTHLFMHDGWSHLLGNMLLLVLVVGPFLEDVWGRPFFLAFYLAGGLVAALAETLPAAGSQVGLVGASGAIGACLGAFMLRFAHRKVRILYWFLFVVRGTFFVPAWAYAAFFGVTNAFNLWLHGNRAGIAFGAHVGGFVFGLGVVLVMRATRLEERLRPGGETPWHGDAALDRAAEALADGDPVSARAAWADALRKSPDDPVALLGLLRHDASRFDAPEATARFDRLLAVRLAAGDVAGGRALAVEFGPVLRPDLLRPTTAYRAGELLEAERPDLAAALHAAAARAGGAVGAKAGLRGARLLQAAHPAAALALARAAAEAPEAAPGVAAEAVALAATLVAAGAGAPAEPVAIELDELPAAPSSPAPAVHSAAAAAETPGPPLGRDEPVRVVLCGLAGADAGGLDLVAPGGKRARVDATRVAAVAGAIVPAPAPAPASGMGAGAAPAPSAPGAAPRPTAVLDLLLHPRDGEPRVVLRLFGTAMDLARLAPGEPPTAAWARIVGGLLDASGARAVPDREAVLGRPFARRETVTAHEVSAWGRSLGPAAGAVARAS